MTSHCARPGCTQPAAATLTYDYAGRTAWLDRFVEPHPMSHDLCDRHAAGLTVPVGWRLDDRRVLVAPLPLRDALAS
jgi:hypothetical protein